MSEQVRERGRNFVSLVEVERDSSDEINGGWVTFDSITADAFNDFQILTYRWTHIDRFSDEYLTLRAPFNQVIKRHPEFENIMVSWIHIFVELRQTDDLVPAEVVLFGDSGETPQVGLSILEVIPRSSTRRLDVEAMLQNEPRAHAGFISEILDIPLRRARHDKLAVAVYDVGQGNCNALVDEHEHPRIYFDLGWSPNFHSKSRPPKQPDFFSCEDHVKPPVVLSHWDMDHWCYAIQNSSFNPGSLTTKHTWKQDALERFWIVRAPLEDEHKLGPLTMAFYRALLHTQLLRGMSAVVLWPDLVKRIPFSAGWLEACRPGGGMPNDRNNSGIAMFVRPDVRGPAVLLGGDADFSSISSASGKRKTPLCALVAPHHGAKISTKHIPAPKKGTSARVVMSVGDQNSYGHPKQESINAYKAKGWVSSRTQDRFGCSCTDGTHAHGNTLLTFGKNVDPKCKCECVQYGNLCLIPTSISVVEAVAGEKGSTSKKLGVSV